MVTQHHYEGHVCVVFSDGRDVRDSGSIHVARWCQLVICESGEKAYCCAPRIYRINSILKRQNATHSRILYTYFGDESMM